jgi:hypothetical protein
MFPKYLQEHTAPSRQSQCTYSQLKIANLTVKLQLKIRYGDETNNAYKHLKSIFLCFVDRASRYMCVMRPT